jgi:hypothetical protein
MQVIIDERERVCVATLLQSRSHHIMLQYVRLKVSGLQTCYVITVSMTELHKACRLCDLLKWVALDPSIPLVGLCSGFRAQLTDGHNHVSVCVC